MKRIAAFLAALLAAVSLGADASAFPADNAAEYAAVNVSAVSALLMNADTGEVLFEKNADEQRAVASTTKIMTALLTLEAGQLDRRFTVDSMAIRVEGTSMGLRDGDIVTRRALCCGMLLPSGNDAANAAAVSVAGSAEAFAAKMNEKAKSLGMKNSHFVTPSGLDAEGHYSTARDMAVLTRAALKNEEFRRICGLTSVSVSFGASPYQRRLYNSNKLLVRYEGCIGVKTGFTDNARRCLVSAAERGGVTLIAVTLNAPDDWNDHTKMLDYGFSAVTSEKLLAESLTVEVVGGEKQTVAVGAREPVVMGLTVRGREAVTVRYHLPAFVYGGIKAGETIGTAEICYNDELLRSVPLTALEDCGRVPPEKSFWERAAEWFSDRKEQEWKKSGYTK